jgi:hypothetical protein
MSSMCLATLGSIQMPTTKVAIEKNSSMTASLCASSAPRILPLDFRVLFEHVSRSNFAGLRTITSSARCLGTSQPTQKLWILIVGIIQDWERNVNYRVGGGRARDKRSLTLLLRKIFELGTSFL